MELRDRAYLLDILDSGRLAIEYVAAVSFDDFVGNTLLQDAVVRRIEIIGEAARRLTGPERRALGDIEWGDWIGLRNVLAHRYDTVDNTTVWEAVRDELPPLVLQVEKLLSAAEAESPTDDLSG